MAGPAGKEKKVGCFQESTTDTSEQNWPDAGTNPPGGDGTKPEPRRRGPLPGPIV